LIIIGLLAGGIVVGSSLVKRARIESAKSLTNRSPIKETEDLVMWFEDSLLDSFANGQSTNGTSISSGWNNIGGGNEIDSATVDGTASTSTLSCDKTGYTGSITYSCASQGSNATITESCGCSTGYVLVSGACVPTNCPVSITGISSPSSVSYTSTSTALPCNVAGYTGSINYTCTTGTLSVTGSCSCATGYSLVSGVCTPITCSITSVSKLNNKTGLAYASSATAIPNTPTSACATGYTDSATYTCTTTGVATIVSNSCNLDCTIPIAWPY